MKKIGIIGTGNLGSHLIKLFRNNNLKNQISLSDINTDKVKELGKKYSHNICNNEDNIDRSDIVFLSVKPDKIKEVCSEFVGKKRKIIVSTAAGVPITKISEWSGNTHQIIRCMPNIPISVSEGSIIWYSHIKNYNIQKTLEGITKGPYHLWLKDEFMMNPATIISGCMPAYVAHFYKAYKEVGQELGFTNDESKQILLRALQGTSSLLHWMNEDKLIEYVASKGGATEKGLDVLKDFGFKMMLECSTIESLKRIENITKSLN